MTGRRTAVYVDGDVQAILEEINPKSVSAFFNQAVRDQYKWQKLCADVAEIKAILESRSPNQTS